jgi:small GTP-binding protein
VNKFSKDYIYKVIIVGDGGVGKTTILKRYVDDTFDDSTKMTIGSDFFTKKILLNEEEIQIILQIWDLGGQSHFSDLRPAFYMGAKGVLYTFDLTRKSTLLNLLEWKKEVEEVIGKKPSILVGNKLDILNEEQEKLMKEETLELNKDLGALQYVETSAKDDVGIDQIFHILTMKVFEFFTQMN